MVCTVMTQFGSKSGNRTGWTKKDATRRPFLCCSARNRRYAGKAGRIFSMRLKQGIVAWGMRHKYNARPDLNTYSSCCAVCIAVLIGHPTKGCAAYKNWHTDPGKRSADHKPECFTWDQTQILFKSSWLTNCSIKPPDSTGQRYATKA